MGNSTTAMASAPICCNATRCYFAPVWLPVFHCLRLFGILSDTFYCGKEPIILSTIGVVLFLSLVCNVICCVRFCAGKKASHSRKTRKRGPRQMENNPIYGNLNFPETSMTVLTEADPPRSSLGSASLRDQHRVKPDSQTKSQDCYANLTLKPPQPQSGRSSPQIQYSDVEVLEEQHGTEDEENAGLVSAVSDLYASVQTHRSKAIDTADGAEGYANHL